VRRPAVAAGGEAGAAAGGRAGVAVGRHRWSALCRGWRRAIMRACIFGAVLAHGRVLCRCAPRPGEGRVSRTHQARAPGIRPCCCRPQRCRHRRRTRAESHEDPAVPVTAHKKRRRRALKCVSRPRSPPCRGSRRSRSRERQDDLRPGVGHSATRRPIPMIAAPRIGGTPNPARASSRTTRPISRRAHRALPRRGGRCALSGDPAAQLPRLNATFVISPALWLTHA
jgi:hypothetical protein